jgi:LysM domain-containing protein
MQNNSTQISHAEAIQLIQFRADDILDGDKDRILSEHLKDCVECRSYAEQLNKMEDVLKSVMLKQWNARPAPLSMATLMGNKIGKKSSNTILLTRTAMISVAFLAFLIIGWQFTATNSESTHATQFEMLPVPTPSIQITPTRFLSANCRQIPYQVHEHDTLESIAAHFAISKETLMTLNNLTSEVIQPYTELLVPICDTTPTSTLNPPTLTITPILDSVTYTQG